MHIPRPGSHCPLRLVPPVFRAGRRRGVTIIEILVAMAIASVFLVSILFSFTQILRTSDESEALTRANNQARAALLYISRDLSAVRRDTTTPIQEFVLENRSFPYGDGIDNDRDNLVDEDPVNGADTDGDWDILDDRHGTIGAYRERPDFVGFPDLGDERVDEDPRFGNDRLILRIPPDPLGLDNRDERITYEIGTYEGQDHVLLRTVVSNPGTFNVTAVTEPLAFNVLGLDILAWNSNDDTLDATGRSIPYWSVQWNAAQNIFPFKKPFGAPDGYPPFEFPTSVRLLVHVYSGRVDFDALNWTPGQPIQTLALATTIDLEVTIKDLRYQVFIRQ